MAGSRSEVDHQGSDLEPPHQEMFDPFATDPDVSYEVRAEDLLRPLVEPNSAGLLPWRKQTTNAPIVSVENRYITGSLDLRAAKLDYLVGFENCRFEHPPDVREASLLGLTFRRCWLPGLKARNLHSRNDVRLIHSRVEPSDDDATNYETTVRKAINQDRGVPDAAVNMTDAVVEGSLVLSHSRITHRSGQAIQADRLVVTGAVLAFRMRAEGETRIPALQAGGNVNLSGASLRNPDGIALNGSGLHIRGSLVGEVDTYGRESTRKRFSSRGVLLLSNATVDSDVVLRGANLGLNDSGPVAVEAWESRDPAVDPHPAFMADRLRVDGNVELSDGLESTSTVRMVNAYVAGTLSLAGAWISVPRGEAKPYYDRAVHLDGSNIDGNLEATGLEAYGHVRLTDVRIRGNFRAWNASITHPDRDALAARRSSVFGNFQLTDSSLEGTLRLQGIQVGGSVELFGTELTESAVAEASSFSLDLRTARIDRDAVLTANQERPFRAAEGVTLDGAALGRKINLAGAVLSSAAVHGVALDLSDAHADEFVLTMGRPPEGQVTLRGAHCVDLDDDATVWSATGLVEVEDFQYDALSSQLALDDDLAVERRVGWLRQAMRGYRPAPYDQLAQTLRASGNDEHADTVLQRKQQLRYNAIASGYRVWGFGVRFWSLLQRSMVGYGYRPVRAVGWLLMLLVAGSLWFGLGTDSCVTDPDLAVSGGRCLVNSDDEGLEWNPVLYTADLLVPIVNLGHQTRWHMAGLDMWVSSGMIAMGWILATTVAAGAGRALRRTG